MSSSRNNSILTLFKNKYWRLNNLYLISDKEGVRRILRLNTAQDITYQHQQIYNRLLELKSRQRGISTYSVIDALDECIFTAGIATGIQSYGNEESKKLKAKALLAWDNLDPLVKKLTGVKLVKRNALTLEFSNGSTLRIGNFRGDTLQKFHVSELAKISKKYPEKANEIKTGAFQAVSTSSKITVETTAEGDKGLFPELWFEAERKLKAGERLTELDFYPLFIGWTDDPDATVKETIPLSKHAEEYIEKYDIIVADEVSPSYLKSEYLEIYNTIKDPNKARQYLHRYIITSERASWLTSQLRTLGTDFDREYPITPEAAFAQSVEGTYFRIQYELLVEENRIVKHTHPKSIGVYTSWDLGWNDETVILFWAVIHGKVFLIDEYHGSGEALPHYVEVLKYKGYKYIKHLLPHDVDSHELITGRTRKEALMRLGLTNIETVPKISFGESIQVARDMLISNFYLAENCVDTRSAIQNYRKKKDEKLGVYLDTDVHDINSNYMAAFRYGSLGLSHFIVNKSLVTPATSIETPDGFAV